MTDAAWRAMSNFEALAFNWYHRNASGWALRAGIVADSFRVLGLEGEARDIFIEIMNTMDRHYSEIAEMDMARKG